MSKTDDTPARPAIDGWYPARNMTVRDWFAGQVIAGMTARLSATGAAFRPDEIASRAYEVADAMIAARGEFRA